MSLTNYGENWMLNAFKAEAHTIWGCSHQLREKRGEEQRFLAEPMPGKS